jgi:hypothetical protein
VNEGDLFSGLSPPPGYEWEPVYAHSELRRALAAAGISIEEYLTRLPD